MGSERLLLAGTNRITLAPASVAGRLPPSEIFPISRGCVIVVSPPAPPFKSGVERNKERLEMTAVPTALRTKHGAGRGTAVGWDGAVGWWYGVVVRGGGVGQ